MKSSEGRRIKEGLLLPLSLLFVTIASRIPFASKLLYHMDSVQFALALDKYDITVHQPHPPGYFLYVMLGRVLHHFIGDANTVFVFISILFSGLTVVAVYYLGRELFDARTGILAAAIALTSPNFWFHGEVALMYTVEAFFSSFVAFCCWKLLEGERRYLWISVLALGIAGGIRQNTMVFLLPLWLFSVSAVPKRKLLALLLLLTVVCLLWFVPMIQMTGGWDAYRDAFQELWLFNTGGVSVFEKGWTTFEIFSSSLAKFTIFGLGAGVFVLGIAAYSLVRNRKFRTIDRKKTLFFVLWVAPVMFFYLLIFIHPANPGYVLIFLPAFFILTAKAAGYIGNELKPLLAEKISGFLALSIVSINMAFFLFSSYQVSYEYIRKHDRDLRVMLEGIKAFDPKKNIIFIGPYIFYGYRQIMYYLPDYRVYQVDVRTSQTGKIRKTFWGMNRQTHLTDEVSLPASFDKYLTVLISQDKYRIDGKPGVNVRQVNSNICIASGNIASIRSVYPELKIRWNYEN